MPETYSLDLKQILSQLRKAYLKSTSGICLDKYEAHDIMSSVASIRQHSISCLSTILTEDTSYSGEFDSIKFKDLASTYRVMQLLRVSMIEEVCLEAEECCSDILDTLTFITWNPSYLADIVWFISSINEFLSEERLVELQAKIVETFKICSSSSDFGSCLRAMKAVISHVCARGDLEGANILREITFNLSEISLKSIYSDLLTSFQSNYFEVQTLLKCYGFIKLSPASLQVIKRADIYILFLLFEASFSISTGFIQQNANLSAELLLSFLPNALEDFDSQSYGIAHALLFVDALIYSTRTSHADSREIDGLKFIDLIKKLLKEEFKHSDIDLSFTIINHCLSRINSFNVGFPIETTSVATSAANTNTIDTSLNTITVSERKDQTGDIKAKTVAAAIACHVFIRTHTASDNNHLQQPDLSNCLSNWLVHYEPKELHMEVIKDIVRYNSDADLSTNEKFRELLAILLLDISDCVNMGGDVNQDLVLLLSQHCKENCESGHSKKICLWIKECITQPSVEKRTSFYLSLIKLIHKEKVSTFSNPQIMQEVTSEMGVKLLKSQFWGKNGNNVSNNSRFLELNRLIKPNALEPGHFILVEDYESCIYLLGLAVGSSKGWNDFIGWFNLDFNNVIKEKNRLKELQEILSNGISSTENTDTYAGASIYCTVATIYNGFKHESSNITATSIPAMLVILHAVASGLLKAVVFARTRLSGYEGHSLDILNSIDINIQCLQALLYWYEAMARKTSAMISSSSLVVIKDISLSYEEALEDDFIANDFSSPSLSRRKDKDYANSNTSVKTSKDSPIDKIFASPRVSDRRMPLSNSCDLLRSMLSSTYKLFHVKELSEEEREEKGVLFSREIEFSTAKCDDVYLEITIASLISTCKEVSKSLHTYQDEGGSCSSNSNNKAEELYISSHFRDLTSQAIEGYQLIASLSSTERLLHHLIMMNRLFSQVHCTRLRSFDSPPNAALLETNVKMRLFDTTALKGNSFSLSEGLALGASSPSHLNATASTATTADDDDDDDNALGPFVIRSSKSSSKYAALTDLKLKKHPSAEFISSAVRNMQQPLTVLLSQKPSSGNCTCTLQEMISTLRAEWFLLLEALLYTSMQCTDAKRESFFSELGPFCKYVTRELLLGTQTGISIKVFENNVELIFTLARILVPEDCKRSDYTREALTVIFCLPELGSSASVAVVRSLLNATLRLCGRQRGFRVLLYLVNCCIRGDKIAIIKDERKVAKRKTSPSKRSPPRGRGKYRKSRFNDFSSEDDHEEEDDEYLKEAEDVLETSGLEEEGEGEGASSLLTRQRKTYTHIAAVEAFLGEPEDLIDWSTLPSELLLSLHDKVGEFTVEEVLRLVSFELKTTSEAIEESSSRAHSDRKDQRRTSNASVSRNQDAGKDEDSLCKLYIRAQVIEEFIQEIVPLLFTYSLARGVPLYAIEMLPVKSQRVMLSFVAKWLQALISDAQKIIKPLASAVEGGKDAILPLVGIFSKIAETDNRIEDCFGDPTIEDVEMFEFSRVPSMYVLLVVNQGSAVLSGLKAFLTQASDRHQAEEGTAESKRLSMRWLGEIRPKVEILENKIDTLAQCIDAFPYHLTQDYFMFKDACEDYLRVGVRVGNKRKEKRKERGRKEGSAAGSASSKKSSLARFKDILEKSEGVYDKIKSELRSSPGKRRDSPKKRRRGSQQRLRSRNRVIDEWLSDEDGHDDFGDLEDFLVD